MKKGSHLSAILRSDKTVFSTQDFALIWGESSTPATRVRLHYFVQKGDLVRIRNGLYARDQNYNRLELATRILTPAYVSFETVLAKEGLVFQYYESIFVASYTTRDLTIDRQTFSFRKIKDSLLMDASGVEHVSQTSIATRERAFLDTLYMHSDYHFDNLRSIDWDFVFQLLPLYQNQRMQKIVDQLFKKER